MSSPILLAVMPGSRGVRSRVGAADKLEEAAPYEDSRPLSEGGLPLLLIDEACAGLPRPLEVLPKTAPLPLPARVKSFERASVPCIDPATPRLPRELNCVVGFV